MARTLLTRSSIEAALDDSGAAAIRSVTEYQPAGGQGDKVFPPTYAGAMYATEERIVDGAIVPCVLLDAVASQANRMEVALLGDWRAGNISLPVITVDFRGHDLANPFVVTSLEAPHRIADALLRDSLLDGVSFRRSEGRRLDAVDLANATALFELCPTALVFGLWDSTGPRGGQGAKFQRALVSEFIGWDFRAGVSTRSRIDPAQIARSAGPVYRTDDGWSLDASEAPDGAKGLRPSEVNHGNVTPSESAHGGGVTIGKAVQTTVLSLPALRRLRFPLDGVLDRQVDLAARTVLATQALLAAALVREQGADLRSRCLLIGTAPAVWELLDGSGGVRAFDLTVEQAREAYTESVDIARAAGLPWMEQEMVLEPNPHLVELVRKSQDLAADQTDGDEDASS